MLERPIRNCAPFGGDHVELGSPKGLVRPPLSADAPPTPKEGPLRRPCSEEAEASRADAAAAGGALQRSNMSRQYGQLAVWALT